MRAHQIRSALLGVIRRGDRQVLWVPDNVNFGNFLYHWLRAYKDQRTGLDTVARRTPAMEPWLAQIPEASRLVIAPDQVGFFDRRVMGMLQDWGVDYDGTALHAFIREVLLPSQTLTRSPATELGEDDLMVNVRRGDYYANPAHFATYAFDQAEYLRRALVAARDQDGPIPRIHVVSDGLDWCRTHLTWTADFAPRVTFADPGETARDNFATIANARRIVLTNSTFGYWAGYVSNVIHLARGEDNRASVIAPWFHARIGDGKAEQLDPRWCAIREPVWELPPAPGTTFDESDKSTL